MARPMSMWAAVHRVKALSLKQAAHLVLVVQGLVLAALLALVLAWPALAQPAEAARHRGTLKREAQRVWGLQAPVATFAAQVHQESGWRVDARSPVGAQGLAQFMPSTASWIGGMDAELSDRTPYSPAWALRALVVYDHWLHQRIGTAADGCQRMAYTLAAYNGGLGWVLKRQAAARRNGLDAGVCLGATCTINPGISPASQRENEHYPPAVLAREAVYRRWGAGACMA